MNYNSCVGEALNAISLAANEVDPAEGAVHAQKAQTYATLALAQAIRDGLGEVANQVASR